MELEDRVQALEKEIADLKLQLEGRRTYIKIPLSVIEFNDKLYTIDNIDEGQMKDLLDQIESDLQNQLRISISFN